MLQQSYRFISLFFVCFGNPTHHLHSAGKVSAMTKSSPTVSKNWDLLVFIDSPKKNDDKDIIV